jgi:hypothetical protein
VHFLFDENDIFHHEVAHGSEEEEKSKALIEQTT